MSKFYAGIGSRITPPEVCQAFTYIAHELAQRGWTLRSGGAKGADTAFGIGAGINSEIYLPCPEGKSTEPVWDARKRATVGSIEACKVITKLLHPKEKALNDYAMECHSRNVYQMLGLDLNTPVKFVVCWTEHGTDSGGTGQSIRLAKLLNIQVIDFGLCQSQKEMISLVDCVIHYEG